MGFAVRATQLGLSAGQTRFDYRIKTYHRDVVGDDGAPLLVDQSPNLTFDAAHQGYATTIGPSLVAGTPLRAVRGGTNIAIPYDGTNIGRNRSLGLLVLHHTNIHAAQVQDLPIRVTTGPQFRVYLPLLQR
jgi:hypothetical protein